MYVCVCVCVSVCVSPLEKRNRFSQMSSQILYGFFLYGFFLYRFFLPCQRRIYDEHNSADRVCPVQTVSVEMFTSCAF